MTHREAIEQMYTDRATIRRNGKITAPNSATRTELVTVYTDQPCRLSLLQLGKNAQSEAQNDIRYETKLFIAPEIVIQQGDEIDVTRGEVVLHYQAGEPFPYSTHQEISLQRRAYA